MIIDRTSTIHDVAAFVAGLQAASRGVLMLTVAKGETPQGLATAWLVTDSLVVVPDYVVSTRWTDRASDFFCIPDGGPSRPIRATIVYQPSSEPDATRPALLRLETPLPKRALRLHLAGVDIGEQIVVLQHPQGVPELKLSIGRVVAQDDRSLRYDADTENGSGGGPVLAGDWSLVAVHVRSGGTGPSAQFNEGISVSTLIDGLRSSPVWSEIAAYQGLADVGAASQELASSVSAVPTPADETALLGAAVRWSINPAKLSKGDRDAIRAIVIDPSAKLWVLLGNERERLLRSATLESMRAVRGTGDEGEPGQQVLDRILAGPPYPIDEIDEAALPYWLQAVRWFGESVTGLPTPALIHRTLGRRRLRSRLDEIAGPGFRGRGPELADLRAWFDDPNGGPMAITGIGGIGKSALVAKLTSTLPANTIQLWLDFDRADVAPDDAVSVVSLVFDQLALQVDGFVAPSFDADNWKAGIIAMGARLKTTLASGTPILLVLDGFEVAQHAARHEEIWGLLELLLAQLPTARVVVSGRAPVSGVVLRGRPVRNVHLIGLARDDAAAWLRDHKIKDAAAIERILDVSRGVPLILHLAVRWLETGGRLADLPDKFPATLVQGFLYQRILDRVVDQELKPLAQDILVLRRLTADMLEPIAHESLPKGADPAEVFARLAREMGLVDDQSEVAPSAGLPLNVGAASGTLQLRPEVRAATLRLLETANGKRVRIIDRRASRWYAKQDQADPANVAELVYHLLRSGDIKGAERAWKDECAPLLVYAEDELPERASRARAWLHRRTTPARDAGGTLRMWELEAVGRIRSMLARGMTRGVAAVLAERPDRSPDGPITIYDAWLRWRIGDATGAADAAALLGEVPAETGAVARDRSILAARLALTTGDERRADSLLSAVEDRSHWLERSQPDLDALTVTAARVRLTVDPDREIELLDLLRGPSGDELMHALQGVLPASDVLVPLLARALARSGSFESLGERIAIPLGPDEGNRFAADLDRSRLLSTFAPSVVLPIVNATGNLPTDPWSGADVNLPPAPPSDEAIERGRAIGLDLMVLAWRRWKLASASLFIARAFEHLPASGTLRDAQQSSILGALGAFAGNEWSPFRLWHPSYGQIGDVVASVLGEELRLVEPQPSAAQLSSAAWIIASASEQRDDQTPRDPAIASTFPAVLQDFTTAGPALEGLAVYLLSPDPLDTLLRRVLGVPDGVEV